jgi:hypothetical protein
MNSNQVCRSHGTLSCAWISHSQPALALALRSPALASRRSSIPPLLPSSLQAPLFF